MCIVHVGLCRLKFCKSSKKYRSHFKNLFLHLFYLKYSASLLLSTGSYTPCKYGFLSGLWSRSLESVESHVFSWSRSRESESVFKSAGVGVGFLKLLESESVFQNCWSRSQESEHLLQLPTPMFIK